MDRREFLKALGGATLIPLLPYTAFANTPNDLKEWFEQNFKCNSGTPGQYLETETGEKYLYQTFAAGILNTSEDDAKRQLTQYFVDKFTKYSKNRPELWWRVEPQFASIEVINWGETWMTAEDVEDKGKPEIIPASIEYDFDSGSYKYVNSKEMLYRMRFRLTIPSHFEQLRTIAKVEGEEIRKI